MAPAVDCAEVAALRVVAVAAVLTLGRSSVVVELEAALEVCLALLDSSSLSELLIACRVDEGRGRPPPELKAIELGERAVLDALPGPPVGVARTSTLVLVDPQT